MQWTQRNIANFGGDPDRVAIFGQSAGAFSVCQHITSPARYGYNVFIKWMIRARYCYKRRILHRSYLSKTHFLKKYVRVQRTRRGIEGANEC